MSLNTASDAQVFDGGRFDIGNTVSQAEGALGSVQDADEAFGLGQAVGTAAIGEAQQVEALGLGQDLGPITDFTLGDVESQANDAFSYANSGNAIGDVQRQANGALGGQPQKGCRLERGSSVGSRPGECFREPECEEVCYDGDEEECSISNEMVCRTVPDQVIFYNEILSQ